MCNGAHLHVAVLIMRVGEQYLVTFAEKEMLLASWLPESIP